MTIAAWLRFAELSLLGFWLARRLYRPGPVQLLDGALPGGAAILALAQFAAELRASSDPLTSPWQLLPTLLGTWFGVLSVLVLLAGLGAASALHWLARRNHPASTRLAQGSSLALLFVAAAATAGVPSARAAASSGEIAMSPTLTVPRSATALANPYASDPGSAQRGQAVYQQNCVVCHGLTGEGNGPLAANMRIHPPSFRNPQHYLAPGMDGAHFWVIQHGDGQPSGMPAWQGRLTDQQMWDALDYVKTLASRG